MESLWRCVYEQVTDPRQPQGVRHAIASLVCLATLAVAARGQGPHAIFEFAQSLNHGQRRRLRCHPRRGHPRQCDVPCERTFRRMLKVIDADQLRAVYARWMAGWDPRPLTVLPLDGKVLRNADPAPPRLKVDAALAQAAQTVDTPALSRSIQSHPLIPHPAFGHPLPYPRARAQAFSPACPAGWPGERGNGRPVGWLMECLGRSEGCSVKAAEDSRTPGHSARSGGGRWARSVAECASPLALWGAGIRPSLTGRISISE
jgi:hypothetical protein